MSIKRFNPKLLIVCPILLFLVMGCGDSKKETSDQDIEEALDKEIDSTASTLVKFNNVVFSVPSPYQFAFFIKDLGIKYNKEYLSSTKTATSYSTTFKKAVNMGVYGTDLAYLNIYEQIPDAVSYFSVLKILANDIGIANAFDQGTVKRIEQNMGNKDSLLYILSNTYRKADAYLKDNDRNANAVLILAGGWVESLYILSRVAAEKPNEKVFQRIAEQKHPLDNLIKILSPYYNNSPEYVEMTDQLIELAYEFDGIEYKYEFKPPTHDAKKKLTIVNSVSTMKITEEQVKNITKKISALRNSLISK